MSREEKPLQYERRVLDTKNRAQRIDLFYFLRPTPLRAWRRRLTLWVPLLAAAGIVPFVLNIGGGERVFSNGPVSRSHAVFEQDCSLCHAELFSHVKDAACLSCHDGPAHVSAELAAAMTSQEAECAECHIEHRGETSLASVSDGNCLRCHESLDSAGAKTSLRGAAILAFEEGGHPDFPDPDKKDLRPLIFNHATHMPAEPKKIRNIELPLKCSECHETDRESPNGDLLPVTFDDHCIKCHEREMQFDIFQLMGEQAQPAPHTKDARAIQAFVMSTYQQLLASNPGILNTPVERGAPPETNPQLWLAKAAARSERFLFDRKCVYCHEYEQSSLPYPLVKPPNVIAGQYQRDQPRGPRWLDHADFNHRSHRAVDCASCHSAAATSEKTADVLVPGIKDCLPCHGDSGTTLDRCSECHQYHDQSAERDRDRRPVEELLSLFQTPRE